VDVFVRQSEIGDGWCIFPSGSYTSEIASLPNLPPLLRGVVFIRQAAALASYAKQAKDEELEKMARRIRARAIRRAGELLNAIEAQSGKRTDVAPSGDAPTRSQAAQDAGMSRDQQVQAVRVANVPETDFEQAVEGDDPPPARGE